MTPIEEAPRSRLALALAIVVLACSAWIIIVPGERHEHAREIALAPPAPPSLPRPVTLPFVGRELEASAPLPGPTELQALFVEILASESGEPLPDATLEIVELRASRGIRRADEHGRVGLAPDSARDGTGFTARAPGRVTTEVARSVLEFRDGIARIALEPAARCAGRVEWLQGGPVGAGVSVLAVPIGRPIFEDEAVLEGLPRPPASLVTTRADGRFAFDDLDPDVDYSLVAFDAGRPPTGRVTFRAGSGDRAPEPVLQIYQLFGIRLNLVDARTGTLQCAPRSYGPLASGYDLPAEEGYDYDSATDEFLRLAGLPDLETMDGWATRLVLATAPPHHETIGPARFVVELPGYETATSEFHLPRIEREIYEQDIALYADAHGFGRLEIQFDGPLAFERPEDADPVALLELTGNDGETTQYAIMRIEREVIVQGVPFGSYEAWIASTAQLFRMGPCRIEIGHDPARMSVDMEKVGDVECVLRFVDGRALVSGMSFEVTLHAPSGAQRRHVSRDSPPYSLGPLPEGRYTLAIRSPTFTAPPASIDLEPGEVERVELAVTLK